MRYSIYFKLLVFACALVSILCQDYYDDDVETTTKSNPEEEEKISEYILKLLEHYKKPDPIGVPGVEVPEPYFVPDVKKSLTMFIDLYFRNTAIYGINSFRILDINADVEKLKLNATIFIDKLHARGNCSYKDWFHENRTPYIVNITNITMTGYASLNIERNGKLHAGDMHVDIAFDSITTKLETATDNAITYVVQGFINTAGSFLFDRIKTGLLEEAYTKTRILINKQLDEITGDMEFPNTISPMDMVIISASKKIQDMKMDPLRVPDTESKISLITIALTEIWLTGLSSLHRVGNITMRMVNNTLFFDVEFSTKKLEGSTHWEFSALNGFVAKSGTASFSVEYFSARVVMAQPLDTKQKPELRKCDLDVGNIQTRSDGAGSIDYILEVGVNVVPNLLRFQIVKALDGIVKWKMQQELNGIYVDEIINNTLPKIDEMQEQRRFKISAILALENEKLYDEDEFFNF